MSDLVASVSPRNAASIGISGSGTRVDSSRCGRTLRRVAVAGGLGAGAWLAMMAVGQSHASATPAAHVASVLGSPANAIHSAKPPAATPKPTTVRAVAHFVSKTAHSTAATGHSTTKTVGAKTSPVGRTVVVRVATPVRTTVRHTTARVTALPVVKPVVKPAVRHVARPVLKHVVKPVVNHVEMTVGAVAVTAGRVAAPVLAPVSRAVSAVVAPVVSSIVRPIVAPVIAPVIAPIASPPVPAIVSAALVVATSTPVPAAGHTALPSFSGLGSARLGTPSTVSTQGSVAPGESASPGRHHTRAASMARSDVHSNKANGGGAPFGPAPAPAAVTFAAASASAHSHDSGPSLAGRTTRPAPPVSAFAARLGSDRLPGAPIRFTDVSPD